MDVRLTAGVYGALSAEEIATLCDADAMRSPAGTGFRGAVKITREDD